MYITDSISSTSRLHDGAVFNVHCMYIEFCTDAWLHAGFFMIQLLEFAMVRDLAVFLFSSQRIYTYLLA